MKELTIEEKAKRYDEAVGRAKSMIVYPDKPYFVDVKEIFPELKESEDEKWRSWLIGHLQGYKNTTTPQYSEACDKAIAWLEKQVPTNEDEIVKGIRRGVAISLINHIDANSKGMCLSNMECEDIENAIVNEDWDKVYRYTKKKLEKQGEQKPTWSEEDETRIEHIITRLEQQNTDKEEKGRKMSQGSADKICMIAPPFDLRDCADIVWLKSLKQRIQPQPKQEWSEEDEKICQETIDWFERKCFPYALESENPARESIAWLKSLKDRYTWKPSDE